MSTSTILLAGFAVYAVLYGWAFYILRDRDRLGRYPSFDAEQFNRKWRR